MCDLIIFIRAPELGT